MKKIVIVRRFMSLVSTLAALLAAGCFDLEMPDEIDTDSEGVWCDDENTLCWQNPSGDQKFTLSNAAVYCDQLTLEGNEDWRLPTISELRTLIRGWDSTMTGGACGITDECLDVYDCDDENCAGGDYLEGTGGGDCYWVDEARGICDLYWSSSYRAPARFNDSAWSADFSRGWVQGQVVQEEIYVRCVREEP